MKFAKIVLLLAFTSYAGNWLGVKFARPEKEKEIEIPVKKGDSVFKDVTLNPYQDMLQDEILKVRRMHDSMYTYRDPAKMTADSQGMYIGNFSGIRCVNCTPNMVEIIVEDSVHNYRFTMNIREEVWRAVEKPIKDKRVFEIDPQYFYFGFNKVDTIYASTLNTYFEQVNSEVTIFPFQSKAPLTKF